MPPAAPTSCAQPTVSDRFRCLSKAHFGGLFYLPPTNCSATTAGTARPECANLKAVGAFGQGAVCPRLERLLIHTTISKTFDLALVVSAQQRCGATHQNTWGFHLFSTRFHLRFGAFLRETIVLRLQLGRTRALGMPKSLKTSHSKVGGAALMSQTCADEVLGPPMVFRASRTTASNCSSSRSRYV